ncbi:ABC transporter ATP-binding protein [Lactobacillus taiwanensis]|uniref:ABC transporter ATP-binding protein n=1 Tax=Lactobacillus taiwanensis TaxID=508451 RepID=UPI000B98DC53|nr:ABC transporter ATP-binding protein [Lactobacillus taiwanensis]OYR97197.1 ABC transporter ATP-binding protein [Lactobacillus taiwanensis]OYS15172.1 ABC transporter ATP-binding protein [Lactobacillus taiwanensis]OYS21722.1 ABC transporter ATP-binding protein [Lactobacillus taiwanensis]OYS23584.1 ABC transporter ATP-binding protein [Lactobacillus taiwanensis]OYS25479.1 ABC transporter ATP-binding protein [Lactobacillus taiwanensis]
MLIETYNLTKKYGKKLALNKVDLKVDRGQLVAYLGTNGAGKSTTINILTGLLKPTSGTITYAKDLKIGVVFQNSVLDDVLSVKDNLNLRAQMYHDISKNWLEQLIDLIGIRKFLNQKYGTLSGGQKRRVDIARALIDRPNILFLDEPTTGLDLQTRIVIWNLLQKLQKEQGLTIFLTTHYLEEAENADQMYILENGQVLANGSAHEIKNKYAPSKLVIKLNENQQLTTAYPIIAKDKHIELNGLDENEAITLLHQNQAKIKSFEYRQGSIDDAFINIAGKELQ